MTEQITNGTFEGPLYSEPVDWTSGSNCEEGTWGVMTFDEDLGDGENSCALSNYGESCYVGLCQSVDFTDVDTLTFLGRLDSYQRYGPPNGFIKIYAGSTLIYEHTSDDEGWREYSIDVSAITGVQTLCFNCGPYADVYLHHVSAISTPPPPVLHAEFHALACLGWRPFEAQFIDDSTGSPDRWYWRFGDGGHSGAQHPSHVYAGYGAFDVQLEAGLGVDWSFCTKIGYIVVLLPPLPLSTFIPEWSIDICPDG
jgi:hypothetical protein